MTTTSSDKLTAESIDAARQTSIDDTLPEAGKFPFTNDINKGVVLGEPKGQLSNTINQIINKQETEIHVKIKPISERYHEAKLPLQDYLKPGRTYSNRFAIKLPKDVTKKSGVSLEFLLMRERRVDSMDESPLVKIKESLDSLHSALEGQNQFGIYQIDVDTLSEIEQRVDFVNNLTLKNSELMRKFEALSEHIKRLYSQVAENATAIKREAGRLPGRTDANLKRQDNAVLLRSGKCLIPSTIEINNAEKNML
ncbi:hypothetical protein F2Q69_00007537 [Brassica cretica]|uniref:Uncharacterized protein n=1 Tax=Brassica cretica TaxID=69181 RepID=A0A8S9PGN4_BRACR|nr:hypothetical protein F2Q69_00007537 [Brassica cretica]